MSNVYVELAGHVASIIDRQTGRKYAVEYRKLLEDIEHEEGSIHPDDYRLHVLRNKLRVLIQTLGSELRNLGAIKP